jgi:serine-type D-Ala-D-Ala carboxypeptidase/endopeptidase (penicillin-binding protein 4)
MLDFAAAIALWLNTLGLPLASPPTQQFDSLSWLLPPEPKGAAQTQRYLQRLSQAGLAAADQEVWLQTNTMLLVNHGGDRPAPAASLTKVATSLAVLQTLKPQYQFLTQVSATGPVQNGVLQGDLVIQGSGDPLFVWEEAFSLGNALNKIGIKQVTGNLVITGNFAMNYQTDPQQSGQLLLQALNPALWPGEAATQFAKLPPGTPRPEVKIAGQVQVLPTAPTRQTPLITHASLPLWQLLYQMNVYSNNFMAESLAGTIGGPQVVAQQAAAAATVPADEIQLLNGSGLAEENRISPRAVCGMFQALQQQQLQPHGLAIADVFPVAGRDQGTLEDRKLPPGTVVKTGSLWNVSALAGAINTRDYGTVWFAILNKGDNLEGFRQQQDQLLQAWLRDWGANPTPTPEFIRHPSPDFIGNPARNQTAQPPRDRQ